VHERARDGEDSGSLGPLAVASVILAASGAALLLSLVARLANPLEWLTESPTWEGVVALVTMGVLGGVLLRAPRNRRVSWGHVVVLAPAVGLATMFCYVMLHLEFGSPIHDCTGDLDQVDACHGRDWSAGAGHLAVRRATGTLRVDSCRAFASAVAPTLEQRATDDTSGDGRRCTLAAPREWMEVPCADPGPTAFARCFECAGGSVAEDVYVSLLAIDAECEGATLTRTVNMSAATAARCLGDTTDTEACHDATPSR